MPLEPNFGRESKRIFKLAVTQIHRSHIQVQSDGEEDLSRMQRMLFHCQELINTQRFLCHSHIVTHSLTAVRPSQKTRVHSIATFAAVSFFSCSSRVFFASCRLSSCCRFSCEELSNYIIIIRKVLTKPPNIPLSHSPSIQEVKPKCHFTGLRNTPKDSLLGTWKTPPLHLSLFGAGEKWPNLMFRLLLGSLILVRN